MQLEVHATCGLFELRSGAKKNGDILEEKRGILSFLISWRGSGGHQRRGDPPRLGHRN